MKKVDKKICLNGATCKQTCISKSKNCLPLLSAEQKTKIKAAVVKLKASTSNTELKAFIKKNGSIAAARQLLEDLKNKQNKEEANNKISKIKIPKELVSHALDFFLTTGKSLNNLKEIKFSSDRSSSIAQTGVITIDSRKSSLQWKELVFHEMGHFLEYSNNDFKIKNTNFIKERATGPLQSLNTLTNSTKYGPNEMAYPGNFISPYVGKIYNAGTTEIFSIGLQHFANPMQLSRLYKEDPKHFELIIDTLN